MIFSGFFGKSLLTAISCSVLGNFGKKMSNLRYFTIFVIWMVACLVFQYLPDSDFLVNDNLDKIFGYHGIEIVYRFAFSLLASFFLLFLLTLMWPVTHHMFFGVFLVFLLFFTWLFVWGIKSNNWLYGFRNVARFGAGAYLVLQLMSLVDFSFWCHEALVAKIDDTNARYKYTDKTCCCKNQWSSMYITCSFGLFILSIVGCISFYFMFRVSGDLCGRNAFVITLCLVIGILITVLCLHDQINKGFLPPSLFFAIITIYLLNSLFSNPDSECNPFTKSSNYWVTVINVIVTVASGYWMAFRIVNEAAIEEEEEDVEKNKGKKERDVIVVKDEDSFQWCIFNFCMVLACCYLAMMCSAWYTGDITIRPPAIFSHSSTTTFWLYNASTWIGFAVFLYILIAPLLFSDRQF